MVSGISLNCVLNALAQVHCNLRPKCHAILMVVGYDCREVCRIAQCLVDTREASSAACENEPMFLNVPR